MVTPIQKLRARYTVPYICKRLKITRNVWENISKGRTALTPVQTAQITTMTTGE